MLLLGLQGGGGVESRWLYYITWNVSYRWSSGAQPRPYKFVIRMATENKKYSLFTHSAAVLMDTLGQRLIR